MQLGAVTALFFTFAYHSLKFLLSFSVQQLEKKEKRVLRCTLQLLREVWMMIEMEKVNTYEGVIVKVLLDSSATGMFVNSKFVEKKSHQLGGR